MAKKESMIHLSSRIPASRKEEIDAFCEKRGISLASLVRVAIEEYLQNHKNN